MKKITKEKFKEIVLSSMFEPTDEVVDNIMKNWETLQEELKIFDNFDLDSLKPMAHIDEEYVIDFLREDEEDNSYSISKKTILQNANQSNDDFVLITKVVK
ncbi:glutamyl-tRNA amidotransferase [Mycoplasma leonicaptivi]|uniref:glutamyl-tRNA amidotransferase n=1 Tax=Mycoplasma leonicaptivi TaxID=36742 RepID=UPI000487E12E|nr:glutamyl-tRNA amidotransferase [Mycoplasma leonicaptivi]